MLTEKCICPRCLEKEIYFNNSASVFMCAKCRFTQTSIIVHHFFVNFGFNPDEKQATIKRSEVIDKTSATLLWVYHAEKLDFFPNITAKRTDESYFNFVKRTIEENSNIVVVAEEYEVDPDYLGPVESMEEAEQKAAGIENLTQRELGKEMGEMATAPMIQPDLCVICGGKMKAIQDGTMCLECGRTFASA